LRHQCTDLTGMHMIEGYFMSETSLAFHLRNDRHTDNSVSMSGMIMVQSTNAASGMQPPVAGETAILDAASRLFVQRGFDGPPCVSDF